MNNVTSCMRLSHLLALLQNAGIDFTLSDAEPNDGGTALRALALIQGTDAACDAIVLERPDGTYRLFVEQPSPFIADDVKWITAALADSEPLLRLIQN